MDTNQIGRLQELLARALPLSFDRVHELHPGQDFVDSRVIATPGTVEESVFQVSYVHDGQENRTTSQIGNGQLVMVTITGASYVVRFDSRREWQADGQVATIHEVGLVAICEDASGELALQTIARLILGPEADVEALEALANVGRDMPAVQRYCEQRLQRCESGRLEPARRQGAILQVIDVIRRRFLAYLVRQVPPEGEKGRVA